MDNSTTTWIIVALLVLLIGAAIFMLLRRPGGDDSIEGDAPVVDRDRGEDSLDGRTTPEQTQAVAPQDRGARTDEPFDQSSYDTAGAAGGHGAADQDIAARPVGRDASVGEGGTDQGARTAEADHTYGDARAEGHHLTDDRVEEQHGDGDPRTDGHHLADDAAHADDHRDHDDHDLTEHDPDRGQDTSPLGAAGAAGTGAMGEGLDDQGHGGAPADESYRTEPADEGYRSEPAEETAYRQEPTVAGDRETASGSTAGTTDEPLTADEVLAARGADAGQDPQDEQRSAFRADDSAGASGATTAEAVQAAPVDEPVTDPSRGDDGDGAVFAESVFGPGSVEPAEDGSGPQGWEIKGNTGSMLFHTADSPSYDAVRAEVWFDSEEAARAAGFAHWDRRRR